MKKYLGEEEMFQEINQHSVNPVMVLVWTQAKTNRTPSDPENRELSRPQMGTPRLWALRLLPPLRSADPRTRNCFSLNT